MLTKTIPLGKTVLIVEDDEALRNILLAKLEQSGITTLAAADGDDALYKAIKHKPSVVVLDLILPHMGGLELLSILRKHAWGKNIPVVVLTNIDDINTMNECIKHGVKCHYIKSNTSIGSVVETVRSQLMATA